MARITITRGRPYDLTVVVKGPDTTNPHEMTPTATAIFYIIDKNDNKQILNKPMTREGEDIDGKFLVQLTEEDTLKLPFDTTYREDNSEPADMCRSHVAVTDENHTNPAMHHLDVLIPSVYVADIGL